MPAIPPILGETCTREIPCELPAVVELCQQAREFFARAGLPALEIDGWELALAEAANNAVKYCRPEARTIAIRVDLVASAEWMEVRITDHTPGFDWPDKAELPPDDSESGRGVFLIQALTDESQYLRGRGVNCLILRKRRTPAEPATPATPPTASVDQELQEARHTLDLMTEELASSYESLSAIFRFTAELQRGDEAGDFVPRWLGELLTVVEADWFVLRLRDSGVETLRMASSSSPEWQSGPIQLLPDSPHGAFVEAQAALRRSDVWIETSAPIAAQDPLLHFAAGGCGLAHPLFVNDRLMGVLSIGRRDGQRPFQAGEVNVIQTFGDFLGLQTRNRQLQEAQVRARLNTRDLEIAANLQQALLPKQLVSIPQASLSCYYRSARAIGGDYFDAYPVGKGNLLLVVADVMGKGLPAALFAFMFRSLLRARRDLAARPGEYLAWLNQNLFQELDQAEMFITAQIAFLDCERGEICVASAGHPPLLIAHRTGAVTEVSAGGPPLGIDADSTFSEARQSYTAGHALMFTDGLMEARNPQGDLLGLEAIKAELASATRLGESNEVTKSRLVRLLQSFEQNAPAADDTAFIVIVANK